MPTMTRTAEVKTRTTAQIKADAAAVYARWGISLSDAINIFLAKSIEVGGLPFDMRPETPTFDGLERYAYRPSMDANGVALESVKRGSLGAHIEGEAANLNRLGQEDVDRVREANSPACVDSCRVGLDLSCRAGLHLGGAGHRRHCRSFRQLHYSP